MVGFVLGNNINVGTEGEQVNDFDNSPPTYEYRPLSETFGEDVATSICPHSLNEYKARLRGADTFFRALEVGTSANNIWIEVTNIGDQWTLTVSNDTITETYTETQIVDTAGVGAPSAIPNIRIDVNANSVLIDMPTRGDDIVDLNGTDPRTGRTVGASYGFDEDILALSAKTYLNGGVGLPSNPSEIASYPTSIRTGPQRSLAHINWSERNTTDGAVIVENIMLQWAGSSVTDGQWAQLGVRAASVYS